MSAYRSLSFNHRRDYEFSGKIYHKYLHCFCSISCLTRLWEFRVSKQRKKKQRRLSHLIHFLSLSRWYQLEYISNMFWCQIDFMIAILFLIKFLLFVSCALRRLNSTDPHFLPVLNKRISSGNSLWRRKNNINIAQIIQNLLFHRERLDDFNWNFIADLEALEKVLKIATTNSKLIKIQLKFHSWLYSIDFSIYRYPSDRFESRCCSTSNDSSECWIKFRWEMWQCCDKEQRKDGNSIKFRCCLVSPVEWKCDWIVVSRLTSMK